MLSVGAVPPTEEAIKFHVMSDCSSANVERQRGGSCGQSGRTISVPACTVTHTHTKQPQSEYVMPC